MTLFPWDDNLAIGVDLIDEEHKKLLDLFNTLDTAIKAGRGADILESTVDQIIAYTAYHFRHEEDLFMNTPYPRAAQHKGEHESMARRIGDIHSKLRFGASEELSQELYQFLKDWLCTHTQIMDRSFVPYLKENGKQD